MGIKLKITLAFSIVFILLSLFLNFFGYQHIRAMMIADDLGEARLTANLHQLRTLLLISIVVSVLVSGAVSFVLARLLLLPLQRIIHAAKNISANSSGDPIPVNGTRDELHELSVTINEMTQRINESLQQQQNFFGSASHELKTPLAILRTELEVGLRKQGLEDGLRQLLSNQLEEISRLQEIVNEFLVVSQLRVGSPSIYRKPFDLSVLVVKVFNQLLPLLRQKNLQPVIRFDEEATDFILTADEDKIRIVLLNLLENAAKYGVQETAVICKVERLSGAEALTVQFTNTTREEKVRTENLQVAFYRSDLVQKGAGLGLWLCNEIIRLHDGEIDISSGQHQFHVRVRLNV
jgi:two-component system heavy metal sensor histidine kinase CusS